MTFMQSQIEHGKFFQADTNEGIQSIPADVFSKKDIAKQWNVKPSKIETVTGFFARLSAAGYMDCTEWSGPFDSEAEAESYLRETYGDDDESEEIYVDCKVCANCGQYIHDESGVWVDETGGDVCGVDGNNSPHTLENIAEDA